MDACMHACIERRVVATTQHVIAMTDRYVQVMRDCGRPASMQEYAQ